MIIFHEGMPGSGKSYAAMRDHIIPAVKKGRKVFARMNGLDRDRIAEVAGIDRARLDEQLFEIDETEVDKLCRVTNGEWQLPPDCLLVIDELQNFFPQKRAPLDQDTIKFVAEHRHRGMDILAMGQLLKDCHRTWVNRTNRKYQFLNRDVVGKADEYKWRVFNGQPDSKGQVIFNEITGGKLPYDKSIFGTYKSFQDDTENTERLVDDRTNVYNSKAFRVYLPLVGLVALLGLGYVGYLFSGGGLAKSETKNVQNAPMAQPVKTVIEETGKPVQTIIHAMDDAKPAEPKANDDPWPDLIGELAKKEKIRLAYAIRSAKHTRIVVEFRDTANQIVNSFDTDALKQLGWGIMVSDDLSMVSIARQGKRLVATAWPIPEPVGKVSNTLQDQIRNESRDYVRISIGQSPSGARAYPLESAAPPVQTPVIADPSAHQPSPTQPSKATG